MAQQSHAQFSMDRIPVRRLVRIVPEIVALALVISAFFEIEPEEDGVVLPYGKYARTANPGLDLRVSLVERVLKIPIQRQLKNEFGFRTVQAGVRSQYAGGSFLEESLVLTGDLNTLVVESCSTRSKIR